MAVTEGQDEEQEDGGSQSKGTTAPFYNKECVLPNKQNIIPGLITIKTLLFLGTL